MTIQWLVHCNNQVCVFRDVAKKFTKFFFQDCATLVFTQNFGEEFKSLGTKQKYFKGQIFNLEKLLANFSGCNKHDIMATLDSVGKIKATKLLEKSRTALLNNVKVRQQ